jgi:hypothetical protein
MFGSYGRRVMQSYKPLGLVKNAAPAKTYGKSDFTPEVPGITASELRLKAIGERAYHRKGVKKK